MLTIHANYNTYLTESDHNLCNLFYFNSSCITFVLSKHLDLIVMNNQMNLYQ